ncbi:MAG: YsnF/AvaK domain-containing protein [Actinomycetota bacterium]|nr:YsnF/AvaK domain-containing protein [Actinomycetota bacterium]
MITLEQARQLSGKTMIGPGGEKLGKIDTLYADREDGEPTFATVQTGMFGTKTHFVPLQDATLSGEQVQVPYDKSLVNDAPNIDPDAELSPEEEERLYAHYGLGSGGTSTGTSGGNDRDVTTVGGGGGTAAGTTTTSGESPYDLGVGNTEPTGPTGVGETTTSGAGTGAATGAGAAFSGRDRDDDARGTVGRDTSGPTTDDAMTRSEERLRVGTEQRETGRARLRKFITSETETRTVPVSREEVRVEREPITDANASQAYDGPALSEEEHEVTLTEERAVVDKETVPVERVRLDKATVTEQQQISEEVRKEQIEVEGDGVNDRNR